MGARGQLIIAKNIRDRLGLRQGVVLELEEAEGGLLFRVQDSLKEMKGLGKGLFGYPLDYQRRLLEEWRESPLGRLP